MVHGLCHTQNIKAPCIGNEKCTKSYPKDFVEATTMDQNGYPIYRRTIPIFPEYSTATLMSSAGIRCVKYIHKYIYKGHDRTTMVLGGVNEIQQYLDARYIGLVEPAWRFFGNSIHEEFPPVVRLALHLPGMHKVVYDPNESVDRIASRAAQQV